MTGLWLLLGLPTVAAITCGLSREALATAIARATALVTALLATAVALKAPLGAAVALPWIPERGLAFALALDPLAIPGILTVAWVTALATTAERGRGLALLLAGEAVALTAWLADDTVTLVAALSLLAPLAAAMVSRGRQATAAVFLPLSVAAAAVTVVALLLGLGFHEATIGAWSFALRDALGVVLPSGLSAPVAMAALVGAWILAGVWPLHGWWRTAAEVAPAGRGAWLVAVVRPLGIGLLARISLPAVAGDAAAYGPLLGVAGGLALVVGLVGAAHERVGARRHLHLAHVPIAAALIGVAGVTAEGLSGALLLGLGGGLAFALAHLAAASPRPHRAAHAIGLLGLLAAPGILGFAGLLPVATATLMQGEWLLTAPALLGLLLLVGPALGLLPALGSVARGPRLDAEFHPREAAGAHLSLSLAAALLVFFGLVPSMVHWRVNAAGPPWMRGVYERWCVTVEEPQVRPRPADSLEVAACEQAVLRVRARLRERREEGVAP
jgi:formate hydrogenlyase subunit 3/multisubunit Na+/H+ antiporter MnhD subunit